MRPHDFSTDFGSAGRLESFVMMDAIAKYPEDLADPFLGTDSALAVLSHETGHRWLANAVFRDGTVNSRELLGRDEVHWSFFMDSDASHLEGTDLADLGDGSFQTGSSGLRYSALDQYLMGLRAPEEVPPLFFARDPSGLRDLDPGRSPRPGVSFSGERVDVTIDDLVAAMGPRTPPAGEAPTVFRQAYVYVSVDGDISDEEIARVDDFRIAFEEHFLREGRLGILVGDVAGKGLPAALLMTSIVGSVRALLSAGLRGSELIAALNRHVCANASGGRFVTLFYGELDAPTGTLTYVNAGHNPPFLLRADKGMERLDPTAMVLGVMADAPVEAGQVQMNPDDRLLLSTDGLSEAFDRKDQEYGDARVAASLARVHLLAPPAAMERLIADVLTFCGSEPLRDDMTLMLVTRQGV